MKLYSKHPDAKLDYSVDYTDFLGADTISTSNWTVPAGLTGSGAGISGGKITTIWLDGGTLGTEYQVTNSIVTAAGREESRSFIVRIENL